MIEILSVVVCYKNASEVKWYASQMNKLFGADRIGISIVVNSANDEDIEILNTIRREVSYPVYIYYPRDNLGYLKGLIYGYDSYMKTVKVMPKYIIMGNTDIEITDKYFIEKILKADYCEDIWCIGPSVYTKYTHNYDNPVAFCRRSKKEIDSLILRFTKLGSLYVWLALIKAKYSKKNRIKKTSQFVYEVHGCFFILSSKCAEHLKDHYFQPLMYSEETFIAEIVYENNKKVYYDSDLEVVHLEHTATGLLGNNKIAKYLAESMKYIRDEFYE